MFSKRLPPRRWSKNALHYGNLSISCEIGRLRPAAEIQINIALTGQLCFSPIWYAFVRCNIFILASKSVMHVEAVTMRIDLFRGTRIKLTLDGVSGSVEQCGCGGKDTALLCAG